MTADIWFRCYGVIPVSNYLAGGLAGARGPDGLIEVTPTLQVAGQRHGSEDLLPAAVVAELKGRDMMVGRFSELLGVPAGDTPVPAGDDQPEE